MTIILIKYVKLVNKKSSIFVLLKKLIHVITYYIKENTYVLWECV